MSYIVLYNETETKQRGRKKLHFLIISATISNITPGNKGAPEITSAQIYEI
jgi:hypothetical protein